MVTSPDIPDFTVTYEGPALDDGRMPVKDLAPALLALGELFHETHSIIAPDEPRVGLDIRAFDRGSFSITLTLAQQSQDIVQQTVSALTSGGATSLANLIAYITGGSGLFAVLIKLYKRTITKKEIAATAGFTRLTLDDGTVFEVPDTTLLIYERKSIRDNAQVVVAPLQQNGINRMRIKNPKPADLIVEVKDLPAFAVPEVEIPLLDTETKMALTIATLSFAPGNKWKLGNGEQTFFVTLADEDFLHRVNRSEEVFSKGDALICRVQIQQWQTATGLKTEHTVLEVLEHIPAARPLDLPMSHGEQTDA